MIAPALAWLIERCQVAGLWLRVAYYRAWTALAMCRLMWMAAKVAYFREQIRQANERTRRAQEKLRRQQEEKRAP